VLGVGVGVGSFGFEQPNKTTAKSMLSLFILFESFKIPYRVQL
jgi:hypothetical protein